jgi:hypothetical protein
LIGITFEQFKENCNNEISLLFDSKILQRKIIEFKQHKIIKEKYYLGIFFFEIIGIFYFLKK